MVFPYRFLKTTLRRHIYNLFLSLLLLPISCAYKIFLKKKKIVLLVQYYKPADLVRAGEIDFVFSQNIKNELFDKIVIFDEAGNPFKSYQSTEVVSRPIEGRIKFSDFIGYISLDADRLNSVYVIANSDIILTPDVLYVSRALRKKELIALTRHERGAKVDNFFPDTYQDTWIVSGDNDFSQLSGNDPITMGCPACDHLIATFFADSGFKIWNPSYNVRSFHVHESQFRSYTDIDLLAGTYTYPNPCFKEFFFLRIPVRIIKNQGKKQG